MKILRRQYSCNYLLRHFKFRSEITHYKIKGIINVFPVGSSLRNPLKFQTIRFKEDGTFYSILK